MTNKKTAHIAAVITDEHKKKLEKLAITEERTVSWLVSKAIDEFLKKKESGK